MKGNNQELLVKMNKWKTYRLGEICDLVAGFAFKSNHFGNYANQVIKIADIQPPIVKKELMGVDLSTYDTNKLKKYIVSKGDFVLAMTGATIGKIGRVTNDTKAYINQRVLTFRPNPLIIDKSYLYYLLSVEKFNKYILNHIDSETAQPNISANSIGGYEISLPPLAEQKRIADILSAIDDKIELNRRINANLEQQAQVLYKSWFVDFEPFGGKMPEDWRVGTLGEICITNKRSYSGKFYNSFEYLDTGSVTSNKIDTIQLLNPTIDKIPSRARRAVTEGDILYSSVRPNQKHYMFLYNPSSNMVVSTGFIVITANWSGYRYYIYQYLIQDIVIQHLQSIAEQSVSTYPSINASDITNLEINIPSNKAIEKYANVMNPIMKQITNNQSENLRLAQLRDTLLPKLMSGEITV